VITTITIGPGYLTAAFDGTHLWVAQDDHHLAKLDLTTNTIIDTVTVTVGTNPTTMAYDGTHLWVVNNGSNNVTKIDPLTDTVLTTIAVGTTPTGIAYDDTNIWVANRADNTVTKLLR